MIPLKEGERASPDWSVTDSTSGTVPSTVSVAVSPSRRIRTVLPSTSTSEPSVTAGAPRRSPSIAGTTPIDPSVEAIPQTTRSHASSPPIFEIASASTSEVASASDPAIASSTTCTPLSAPICKALRIASVACSGPTDRTGTVLSPVFSLICSACSTAYSSSSESSPSTPTRSTVWSSSKCRSAVASGTYFTHTTMFMRPRLPARSLGREPGRGCTPSHESGSDRPVQDLAREQVQDRCDPPVRQRALDCRVLAGELLEAPEVQPLGGVDHEADHRIVLVHLRRDHQRTDREDQRADHRHEPDSRGD